MSEIRPQTRRRARRLVMAPLAAAVGLVVVLAVPTGAARAHSGTVTYLTLAVEGRDVNLSVKVRTADLDEMLKLDADKDGYITADEVTRASSRIARYIGQAVDVSLGVARCEPRPQRVSQKTAEKAWARVEILFRCPRQIDRATFSYRLFFDRDPRHVALARIVTDGAAGAPPAATSEGSVRTAVISEAERTVELSGRASLAAMLTDYTRLGVLHIFTGYDHILFLIGLLLAALTQGAGTGSHFANRARQVIAIVTAFTLAHSITLIAAALNLVNLPSRLVESVIAASIVYVGVENLCVAAPRRRWLLTFAFGLVHGFGFATVLGEIGLPRGNVVSSLLAFNLGVELGQVAIVLLALPLLGLANDGLNALASSPEAAKPDRTAVQTLAAAVRAAARFGRGAPLVTLGSTPVVLFGLMWLIERAFNVKL